VSFLAASLSGYELLLIISFLGLRKSHFRISMKSPGSSRTVFPWLSETRFLCRECKKWKSPLQYSNKQCNDYRYKVHACQRVTSISAELRCRNCTGDQAQELLCTGPCALWKVLNDFSKNQRRRPENAVSCLKKNLINAER
jgi:hypothetical protein